MHDITLIDQPLSDGKPTRFENDEDIITAGDWFWVKSDETEWFGCATVIGSNFAEIHAPPISGSSRYQRILFTDFWQTTRREPSPDDVTAQFTQAAQDKVRRLMGEVQDLTRKLGVVPSGLEIDHTPNPTSNNALAVISSQIDPKSYEKALIIAKEETLPKLFDDIKKANAELSSWMMAPTLALTAAVNPLKKSIDLINDRIHTIGLYAGLTEVATQVREGSPADRDAKLHIMQRRLYMDEECLLDYAGGGIDIQGIEAFDAWISKPENRDRVLPFDRSLVAFRVRRHSKQREAYGSLLNTFINISLAEADKLTFLYIRNGEQIWRISTDHEFDEMIFPSRSHADPGKAIMVEMFINRVRRVMSIDDYEVQLAERQANHITWIARNPDKDQKESPYAGLGLLHGFQRFDPNHPYFDEITADRQANIKKFNRVAVIVQGLFDRSLVFHPHNPVHVWNEESFSQAIELSYDGETLTYGEKPDFLDYQSRLNAAIGPGTLVAGADDFFLKAMAEKENQRQQNDWRNRGRPLSDYTRFQPDGNPGPGMIATVAQWKPRAKAATFKWLRSRIRWDPTPTTPTAITIPVAELLNVSAYTPGDFRQFFLDPRTRAEYLRWAPLMLAAEDYHAGRIKAQPIPETSSSETHND